MSFYSGHIFASECPSYVKFKTLSSYAQWEGSDYYAIVAELGLVDQEGNELDKSNWSLESVDSEEWSSATSAFDNNPDSHWHTEWQNVQPTHPHELVINLNGNYDIKDLRYLTNPSGGESGRIKDYQIFVSTDGANWGQAVGEGVFSSTSGCSYILM